MRVVADVHPKPPGAGLIQAAVQHVHRGVVGVDHLAGQHFRDHQVNQPPDGLAGLEDPLPLRRAGDDDPVPLADGLEAVERDVVAVFADDHEGPQARRGQALFDRFQRFAGGDDLRPALGSLGLARLADVLQPDVLDDLQLGRDDVELLAGLRTNELPHLSATRAGLFRFGQVVDPFLPRQVGRQLASAVAFVPVRPGGRLSRGIGSGAGGVGWASCLSRSSNRASCLGSSFSREEP